MADPIQYMVNTPSYLAPGTQYSGRISGMGSAATHNFEARNYEMARSGRTFCGGIQLVTSAVVPVVDLPTTTAPLYLHNAASDGGKWLVIKRVAMAIGSGTAGAAGFTIFAGVTAAKTASPPTANGTNYSIQATRGGASSVAFMKSAQTVPSGTAWTLLAGVFHTAVTVVGIGTGVEVDGLFVVPPGYGFCFGAYADTGTTAKYIGSCIWDEVEAVAL